MAPSRRVRGMQGLVVGKLFETQRAACCSATLQHHQYNLTCRQLQNQNVNSPKAHCATTNETPGRIMCLYIGV
jgi:hypothetical protein